MMGAGVSNKAARISADRVGKWFGEVIAVNNCSLNVGTGVVGLLGANGAGKSTLFKMLAGMIEPSHGTVRVFGRKLRQDVGWYRRVGFCPESDALPSWMTGREFLSLMLRLMEFEKPEVNRRVDYWLERFELTAAAGRRMGGYSKGMRQKM
ncbi:MAG: ABC transporter ATP-binding protein, partial [Candidatus Krumholzibacteria bacterium]|nr:ABC transporter ATP-binding protein [Candidatus Krumholzibacteria bacterium]